MLHDVFLTEVAHNPNPHLVAFRNRIQGNARAVKTGTQPIFRCETETGGLGGFLSLYDIAGFHEIHPRTSVPQKQKIMSRKTRRPSETAGVPCFFAGRDQDFAYCVHLGHGAGDLSRTETSGTHINVLWRTVYDCPNTFDVGFPRAVGAAVRVRHLIAEHNALATKITFGHFLLPPRTLKFAQRASSNILTDISGNCKHFFQDSPSGYFL